MIQTREKWVADVKLFACILVALGHFFQSMVTSGVLAETGLYSWFNRTIYYFHVPLFFLCSGYLHQKKSGDGSWAGRTARKAVSLGVPYVVFSTATWLLKEVFSGSVNTRNAGLMHTLLAEPASPYWYLYTLFFLFLVIPRVSGGRAAVLAALGAATLKGLRILGMETGLYPVDSVMDNALWFVLGMLLRLVSPAVRRLRTGILWGAAFLAASIWISAGNIRGGLVSVLMGLWGCASVLLILRNREVPGTLRKTADLLAGYTMPVFLMHTIFAAGFRAVLMKLGIMDPVIHVAGGILVSFAGPVLAAVIMERLKLDIVLYPNKYLFRRKNNHG